MAETKEYVGTVKTVELSRTGKSRRVNVESDNGKNLWMSISIDKTPPPAGERFKIKYAEDTWNGKPTRWIENYTAMGPAPASRNGAQKGDTFPTVEEQFIKEVAGNPHVNPCDPGALRMAVANALAVWDDYKAGKLRASAPAESATSDMMDAPSADDGFEDEIPF